LIKEATGWTYWIHPYVSKSGKLDSVVVAREPDWDGERSGSFYVGNFNFSRGQPVVLSIILK
jgi:hypothetical protein